MPSWCFRYVLCTEGVMCDAVILQEVAVLPRGLRETNRVFVSPPYRPGSACVHLAGIIRGAKTGFSCDGEFITWSALQAFKNVSLVQLQSSSKMKHAEVCKPNYYGYRHKSFNGWDADNSCTLLTNCYEFKCLSNNLWGKVPDGYATSAIANPSCGFECPNNHQIF